VCWATDCIGEEVSERYHYEALAGYTSLPARHISCRRRMPAPRCWPNAIGEKVLPLIHLTHEELLSHPFIQMDETYLQVVRSGKAPSSDHYMVVRAAGPPGRRIILFNHERSRTTQALQNLLIGPQGAYRGKLLTDGLEQYDTVAELLDLLHFGCWQHCRTYYHKAAKVTELPSGQNLARGHSTSTSARSTRWSGRSRRFGRMREGAGETLPLERVLKLRQEKSAPVMAAFKDWVEQLLPGVPPKSALGKAFSYTTNHYPEVPVDNNYLENQIRPFAPGRRAWLFAETEQGAKASANLYSLVSCARVNGLEPYAYLHPERRIPRPRQRDYQMVSLPLSSCASFSAARRCV
jgi:transposase